MSNQRNSLSDSVKEQILLESDDPKCVITKLAAKHGITANRIYNWRSKRNHPEPSAITKFYKNAHMLIEMRFLFCAHPESQKNVWKPTRANKKVYFLRHTHF